MRVQIPETLSQYLQERESFSLSGKQNTEQGGHFPHGELIKLIKLLLPEDVWTKICQNAIASK